MKNEQKERSLEKEHLLKQLENEKIVRCEIIRGGLSYCDGIDIRFKSGKRLWIETELDNNKVWIKPRIYYGIGSWEEYIKK